jgi:Xaa-Pro aminopeptidase
MFYMDNNIYRQNRAALLENLENDGLVLLFGSSAPYKNAKGYYGKILDMNFFYVTGIKASSSIAAFWQKDGTYQERLFIAEPIPDEEKWSGVRITIPQAKEVSGMEDVAFLDSFDNFLRDMLTGSDIDCLYLDIPAWHEEDVPAPIDIFIKRQNGSHPNLHIENISPVLAEMRTVKRPEEIECMRKAVANAKAGIDAMMSGLHPGMYEYQLQALCHYRLHDMGAMKAAPMVAAGGNAVILHYPDCAAEIMEDDLVLIDFCPRFNYYASDISRAFPATGKFSPRQKEFYQIALNANKQMIDAVKPGMTFVRMNELCREFLGEGMRSIGLIKSQSEVERYYYHNVSHYIGLGIHDVGNTDLPLPENSVLTIDAGIYVAEEGIGMRVEDDVLITADGSENLSISIIKEIDEIEAFMASG